MKKKDSNNATEETKRINRKETRELETGRKEGRKKERKKGGKKLEGEEGTQLNHKGIRKEARTNGKINK
jgi:hypothetical protein